MRILHGDGILLMAGNQAYAMFRFLDAVLSEDHRAAIERHRSALEWAAQCGKTKRCDCYPTDLLNAVLLYSERIGTSPTEESIQQFAESLAPTEADTTLPRWEQIKTQKVNPSAEGVRQDIENVQADADPTSANIDLLAVDAIKEARIMYHGYIAEQYIKSLFSIGPEGAKEAMIKRWSMDWKVGEHTDSGKPFLEQAAEIRESFNPKENSASKFVPSFVNLAETLSGEDRLFYIAALDSSGKTLMGQTLAADCAAQGIGVTWVSGEHSAKQIKRRFYHLYAHHHRERFDFELAPEHAYLKNTASQDDWDHLDIVRDDMLTLQHWPGPIDVKEISEFPGGFDEVMAYVENNEEQFKTGALFIDPFDRMIECIPESRTKTKYDASTEILTKLLDWTKSFKDGQGLVVCLSCQLNRAFAPELGIIWKKEPENLDAYERALKNAKLHFFSNLKMRADVGIAIASTTHRDRKVVACHHARHSKMFDTFFAAIDGKSLAFSQMGASSVAPVIARARAKMPKTPEEKLNAAHRKVEKLQKQVDTSEVM